MWGRERGGGGGIEAGGKDLGGGKTKNFRKKNISEFSITFVQMAKFQF